MPSYDLDAQWQALEHGHHTCVPAVLANHNLADPSSIPAHRSVVNAAVLTNGAPWMPLDDATYAERKREAEAHLCGQLRARIPSFDERVEVCETGTPRTMKRYSWNPAGAAWPPPIMPKRQGSARLSCLPASRVGNSGWA